MRRRGRHGDDEPPRTAAAHRLGRRPHRRPGGETVVDEHDHAVAQVGRRAVAAVRTLAALELDPLPLRHLLDHVVAEAQLPDELLVEHARSAARDCPHRQLGLPRMAELADEEDVERCSERPRDLARHGHTAARQAEDDDVRAAGVSGQPLGEQPTRLGPVTETPAAPHRPRIMY